MIRISCTVFVLAFAATCQAVTTGGRASESTGPAARAPVNAPVTQEPAKSMVDDSSGLRRGTLENVDVAQGTFQVYGQTLQFDAAKVRIFGRDGKRTSTFALRRGANVRFTLDADDPTRKRVAVVYVE